MYDWIDVALFAHVLAFTLQSPAQLALAYAAHKRRLAWLQPGNTSAVKGSPKDPDVLPKLDARKLKPKPARLRRKETITELFEKRKLVFDLCLKDRQLRAEFLEHVTKELCVESLRFLDAVEAWRNPATQANDDERTLGARSVA